MRMPTGLMGGSFNPAHRGHRGASLHAMRRLGLGELWWLVSPGNPLKAGARDMAPLAARLASARAMARRTPIRASAIEARLGTRYTVDTLGKLRARYPRRQFIWVMGADALVDFHRWRGWRRIAATTPIAILPRPGYDAAARTARVMGWLRRFVRPTGQARRWTTWRAPALVFLVMPPDPGSATRVRAADPHWHLRHVALVPPPSATTER